MLKRYASLATSVVDSRCRYDQAIFVLGHMRCGSTALSHILCDHPAISGYGEAHIRYDGKGALGTLVLTSFAEVPSGPAPGISSTISCIRATIPTPLPNSTPRARHS